MTPPSIGSGLRHPLCGSDFSTLIRMLSENGVPAGRFGQLAIILGAVLVRSPFRITEKILTSFAIKRMPPMKDPIFIVGHWRSGTTHIYNMMSQSPQFGYVTPLATGLPWEMLTLGRILKPLIDKALPSDRLIDSIPITPQSPQEDESAMANMSPLSFYHGLYFPRHFERTFWRGVFFDECSEKEIENWKRIFAYYLKKLSIQQDHRRLLIKNPVYTARIGIIREIWPRAKFIHVHRNPFHVFESMRNFYKKLFSALALQSYDHVDIDTMILEAYSRMAGRLVEDSKQLPEEDYVEVRFEDMEEDPICELERIYRTLKLPGFARALPLINDYLQSVRGYRKNTYRFEQANVNLVRENLAPFLTLWDYSAP